MWFRVESERVEKKIYYYRKLLFFIFFQVFLLIEFIFSGGYLANPLPYRALAGIQNPYGGFLEVRNYSDIPKVQSYGAGGTFSNMSMYLVSSRYPTPEDPERFSNSFLPGVRFDKFGIFSKFDINTKAFQSIFFTMNPDPSKIVYGVYEKNILGNTAFLGVASGNQVKVLLELGRENQEVFGRIGFSIPINSLSLGIDLSNYYEENANLGSLITYGEPPERSAFLKETSVFEIEKNLKIPKTVLHSKSFVVDHPFHKNKPIFPLQLNELLLKKIPISDAIQFEKASKNLRNHEVFMIKAGKESKKKFNYLQYEIRKPWEN